LRAPLRTRFIDKFAALGAASRQTAYRWYNQGLLKRNEAVRAECAERMLDMTPRLGVDRALARDVVCNARGADRIWRRSSRPCGGSATPCRRKQPAC
jgi:hypothetical protein